MPRTPRLALQATASSFQTNVRNLSSTSLSLCLILSLLLFASPQPASAQGPATGTPPFGSFAGSPDVINLANLNSHVVIPILHKAGRGSDFTYDISYDTSVWSLVTSGSTKSWQPVINWGWRGQTEMATGYISRFFQIIRTCRDRNGNIIGQEYQYSNWIYHDPWGTPHSYGDISIFVSGSCGSVENFSDTSDGYTLTTTNGAAYTLHDKFGRQLSVPVNTIIGPGSAIDRNGNTITADSSGNFYDTLNATTPVLTVAGTGTATSPLTFTYTAPSSANAVYTVKYTTFSIQTNFGCSGIGEYGTNGTTTANLVSEIDLPDIAVNPNDKYTFTYESTPGHTGYVTGRLASFSLPTGGTISYTYTGGSSGNITCADGSTSGLQRYTPDTGSNYWNYTRSAGSGAAYTTTVTDPLGNNTVVQFQGIYETQRQIYQGAISPSNILQTTTTCYNANTTNCTSTAITLPVSQRSSIVTLPGGLQSEHDDFWSVYSAPTETDDYDFGSPPHGVLLKKTTATYANLGAIQGLRQTIIVQDGGGNTYSKTVNGYDETSVVATSGTPHLGSVSGARGNLTSVTTYTSASTFLKKTNTYFDTGNVQTATDVNGTQGTYTYGACGNSFPTLISEALSLSRSETWNCTGGVQLTDVDENNQTTTTTYNDPYFWRPASKTDSTGATTNFCYGLVTSGTCNLSPTQSESYMTFNSGNSTVDQLTTLDGLGRSHVKQTRQNPTSSSFDSIETDYDSLGRASRVTLPYVGTAGQTNSTIASTTTSYDALNRPLTVLDGGNGSTVYYYGQANDTLITSSPAPTGENTKKRQFETDGLGRLISVCELTGGTTQWPGGTCAQSTQQTGYWTKYSYSPTGNLIGVTQNAQMSGSTQSRSFAYDWLKRLISETVPEIGANGNGGASYIFDSDPTCGTSNGDLVKTLDAAGDVICSAYDALHRELSRTYPSGVYSAVTPSKYFVYDAATVNGQAMTTVQGRLAEAYTCFSPCSTKITDIGLSYSARGEPYALWESTPHSSGYNLVGEYYWANRATNRIVNYFAMPNITYGVDGEGRINTASDSYGTTILSSTTYNTASLPTGVTYGSGDADSFTFDPNTNRMSQYKFTVNGASLTANLGWNANGTMQSQSIIDGFNSADTQNCSYAYDDMTRLSNANCGSAAAQTFSFDPFGNINKSGTPYSFSPTYSPSTNRMTSVAGFTPTYDGNGNVLNDSFHNYTWDADGHAISVDAGLSDAVSLTYDALGRMVEQNRSGAYTQIVYAPDGQKLALMNGATLQKGLASLPAKAFAVYGGSGLLYYAHPDFIGSIRLASSPGRSIYFDTAYAPFGETYASTGTLDPAYTGKMNDTGNRQDTAGGLYDFPLREYSTQGRWPSPDPGGVSVTSRSNPQTQNRYAYVVNNPLNFSDPIGAYPCSPEDPACGTCDPTTDLFCGASFPIIGGGFGNSSHDGWPGAIVYPVPLLPLGLFSSKIVKEGDANCVCNAESLRPVKPPLFLPYFCWYRCECDEPSAYYHTPRTQVTFKHLLVQHVKQYGRDCTFCPSLIKGKWSYFVEQFDHFLPGINLDWTYYQLLSLTYVSETP